MYEFGEILIKLRKEKGLTQEDLAEVFEVSRQSVSKWETNTTFPETEKLISSAKYFNVSLDFLMSSKKSNKQELIDAEKNSDGKLLDSLKNHHVGEEKEALQDDVKENKLLGRSRKRNIFVILTIIFFALIIGIPLIINILDNRAYKIGDIFETTKKLRLQVCSVNYPGNVGTFDASSGVTYVVIEIEITNVNETPSTIFPEQFQYANKLLSQNSNNGSLILFYNASFSNDMLFKNEQDRIYGISLEPNATKKGFLVFSSPQNALKSQKLIYTETLIAENKSYTYSVVLPNVNVLR